MRYGSRALALLLVLQAASAWALPAGVLCVSRGGHVALESTASACCHPEEHAGEAVPDTFLLALTAECCGPCVDIPLRATPPAVSSGGGEERAPQPLSPAWPGPALTPPLALLSDLPPGQVAVPPPLALTALRTIVLTC